MHWKMIRCIRQTQFNVKQINTAIEINNVRTCIIFSWNFLMLLHIATVCAVNESIASNWRDINSEHGDRSIVSLFCVLIFALKWQSLIHLGDFNVYLSDSANYCFLVITNVFGLELLPKIKQILTLFAHVIWLNWFEIFYLAFILPASLHASVTTSPPPHVLHKFMFSRVPILIQFLDFR